jgi:DNA-binding winged helix-turn-helix (wHTH) protein/TolB-like protein
MYESTRDSVWAHGIDLAQEPDFHLGPLLVRPATCEVESNGASQTLQRRVMQVLVALAQARGSVVSQSDLVARCWRGLAVSDDAIYRCISKLRKLAADYPDAPFAIEAIPGVGYRLTAPGHAEDGPAIEQPKALSGGLGFRRWAVAAAVLVLVAAAAFWRFHSAVPDRHPLSVAVQPFEALTDSADARSLARRIPNEVVDAVGDSQIEAVLAGEQAGSSNSPSGLNVTGLLRDDGRSTVVDVRIENGATGAAIWSTEFKRDSRQASDLPLEVGARVADIVSMINFARTANPPLADDSDLTPLLRTHDMIRDARGGDWAPMVENAQGIVARHPDFAFGHSMLAEAYAEAARGIGLPDRAKAMRDAGRREADLTLKMDPKDAGAYAVLSEIAEFDEPYNFRAEEAILLQGIKLARHPKEPLGALYSYEAMVLGNVGRFREALSFQLIAQATDKWGAPKSAKLALFYALTGNLVVARPFIQNAVQRWPNHSGVRAVRQYIAGFYEPPAAALADFDLLDAQGSPDESNGVWRAFVRSREAHSEQRTDAAVRKILDAADRGAISRETEILMLAGLGRTRQAIATANSVLGHQELQAWVVLAPVTRNLRQDPGFVPLAGRMGLLKYWRETGKLPDFCTDHESECSPRLLAAIKSS